MEAKETRCALFLQSLIQLAALCIKERDKHERGAKKLRAKARASLERADAPNPYMGIDMQDIDQLLQQSHSPHLKLIFSS